LDQQQGRASKHCSPYIIPSSWAAWARHGACAAVLCWRWCHSAHSVSLETLRLGSRALSTHCHRTQSMTQCAVGPPCQRRIALPLPHVAASM
jgi:hypothetical protein